MMAGCGCCCGGLWSDARDVSARCHYRGGTRLYYETITPAAAGTWRSRRREDGIVIFLHGMLSAGRSFRPIANALASEGFACYLPDLLGFGRSPWPQKDYSNLGVHIEYLLDCVDRIVAAEIKRSWDGQMPSATTTAATPSTAATMAAGGGSIGGAAAPAPNGGGDVDDDEANPPVRIHLVGHSMGALLAYELACALRRREEERDRERRRQPALFKALVDLTFSRGGRAMRMEREASLMNKKGLGAKNGGGAAGSSSPRIKVASVALLAMPYFQERGEARRGLKSTRRGLFVRFLLACPAASLLLCTLICQQRWFWMPLLRAAFAAFVWLAAACAALYRQLRGEAAVVAGHNAAAAGLSYQAMNTMNSTAAHLGSGGKKSPYSFYFNKNVGTPSLPHHRLDWLEDFFLHSFRSCSLSFQLLDEHRIHDFTLGVDCENGDSASQTAGGSGAGGSGVGSGQHKEDAKKGKAKAALRQRESVAAAVSRIMGDETASNIEMVPISLPASAASTAMLTPSAEPSALYAGGGRIVTGEADDSGGAKDRVGYERIEGAGAVAATASANTIPPTDDDDTEDKEREEEEEEEEEDEDEEEEQRPLLRTTSPTSPQEQLPGLGVMRRRNSRARFSPGGGEHPSARGQRSILSYCWRPRELPPPVLLLHGAKDDIVPPDKSRSFASRLGPSVATLKEFPDADHSIATNLRHIDETTGALLSWLLDVCDDGGAAL